MSARVYKVRIPALLCFIIGIIMIVGYYFDDPTLNKFDTVTRTILVSMGQFAIAIGTISLLRAHITRVSRKKEGWVYSIALIVSMLSIMVTGILLGSNHPWFITLYNNIYVPLNSTTFALLAFFMASAAYRAFIARNVEATLMLVTGGIMMMARVSAGEIMWSGLPALGDWFLNVPNTAGMRAIQICVSIGSVATAIKILLGYDKTYMGIRGGKEKT